MATSLPLPRIPMNGHEISLQAPRHILSTSPVQHHPPLDPQHLGRQLPLSLILLITSFLDNSADISRVCRSSKLLFYLNLPKLYENVVLRSYPEIRYFDGTPEGFGGGSPFTMAFDGLVSRNVGNFVRTMKLVGQWKETDVEEFSHGRVPDNTMLLNIVIKAALERMEKLQSFSWELNTKPLKSIYQGLASRPHLTSLTLKFPSSRIVRPTVLIPPIPGIKQLHLINLDPLAYPDDLSILFLHCRKLEDLKFEWSPRMRREKEPSTSLRSYFGRCMAAKLKFPIKHVALKNMFARNDNEFNEVFDSTTLQSMTLINCVDPDDPGTIFQDSTWLLHTDGLSKYKNLKKLRVDKIQGKEAEPFMGTGNFEELYLINHDTRSTTSTPASDGSSPMTASAHRVSPPGPGNTPNGQISSKSCVQTGSAIIAAISARHGPSIKKLLLSDRWSLGDDVVRKIIIHCPNLEQLGIAIEHNSSEMLRTIIPMSSKLQALRILLRPDHPAYEKIGAIPSELHAEAIGRDSWPPEYNKLHWIGIGPCFFELRHVIKLAGKDGEAPAYRRVVKPVTWDEIKHVEIFGMDSTDI